MSIDRPSLGRLKVLYRVRYADGHCGWVCQIPESSFNGEFRDGSLVSALKLPRGPQKPRSRR